MRHVTISVNNTSCQQDVTSIQYRFTHTNNQW